MGMYDNLKIKSINRKKFRKEHKLLDFQTKDLECDLLDYYIDDDILYIDGNIVYFSGCIDIIAQLKDKFIEYKLFLHEGLVFSVEYYE